MCAVVGIPRGESYPTQAGDMECPEGDSVTI